MFHNVVGGFAICFLTNTKSEKEQNRILALISIWTKTKNKIKNDISHANKKLFFMFKWLWINALALCLQGILFAYNFVSFVALLIIIREDLFYKYVFSDFGFCFCFRYIVYKHFFVAASISFQFLFIVAVIQTRVLRIKEHSNRLHIGNNHIVIDMAPNMIFLHRLNAIRDYWHSRAYAFNRSGTRIII